MIVVKVETWKRDTEGLFDYQSKEIILETIKSKQSGLIIKQGTKIYFKTNLDSLQQNENQLISFYKGYDTDKQGNQKGSTNYYAQFSRLQLKCGQLLQSERAYLVVESLKNRNGSQKGYSIQIGDVIKFGRVEFLVRELRGYDGIIHKTKAKNFKMHKVLTVDEFSLLNESEDGTRKECRICLDHTNSQHNPLITPCNCRGTINYIHVDCLREYAKIRMQKRIEGHVFAIKWKNMKCELCKSEFPTKIITSHSKTSFFSVPKPDSPYMMLLGLSEQNHGIQLVSLADGQRAKIGRSNDSDLLLNDVTVSRYHGWIQGDLDGGFTLFDNQSKFGTLVELTKNIKIKSEPIKIQVGNSVITLNVQ